MKKEKGQNSEKTKQKQGSKSVQWLTCFYQRDQFFWVKLGGKKKHQSGGAGWKMPSLQLNIVTKAVLSFFFFPL